jgi:hypothetical protein
MTPRTCNERARETNPSWQRGRKKYAGLLACTYACNGSQSPGRSKIGRIARMVDMRTKDNIGDMTWYTSTGQSVFIEARGMSATRKIPIRYHVQDGAELGCLAKSSCSLPIYRVQQTGYAIEYCTVLGMIAHVMESQPREDDATVAYKFIILRCLSAGRQGLTY